MLRQLRESRGLTQCEVAEAIGVDATTVGRVESGQRQPSVRVLDSLLVALRATDLERSLALAHVASPASKAA